MPDEIISVRDLIRREAKAAGIPLEVALAIAEQESGFNPGATGVPLSSGERAIGTFQILPSTAKLLGIDPSDPVQNVQGGVKYLRQLFDRHQGDLSKVLAEYGGVKRNTTYVPEVLRRISTMRTAQAAEQPQIPLPKLPTLPGIRSVEGQLVRGGAPPERPPPPPRQIIGSIPGVSAFALPAAGAIGGAALGTLMAGPGAGTLAGAAYGAFGSGIGAGAGELAQMGVERAFEGPPPQPTTAAEAVAPGRRVLGAAATGAVAEGVGRAGVGIGRRLIAPFASKVDQPLLAEAREAFSETVPRGKLGTLAATVRGKPPEREVARILPSEVTSSRLLDVFENVAEGSFLGGTRVTAMKEARQRLAEQKVFDVLNQLGKPAGTRTAGQAVQAAHDQAVKAFRGQEKVAWGAFREAAGDLPGSTPRLDAFVQNLRGGAAPVEIVPNAGARAAAKIAQLGAEEGEVVVGGVPMAVGELPDVLKQVLAAEGPPGPPLTAIQLQEITSGLGKLQAQLTRAAQTDPTKNNQLGLAKKLYSLARQDLEESLEKGGDEVLQTYTDATALSAFGNKRLFNESVRKMAKQAPEQVARKLWVPDNSTAIEAVRRAVGDEVFQPIQYAIMRRELTPNAKTGRINWGSLASRLQTKGEDTVGAMFPKGHADEIIRTAKLMNDLGRKGAGGIGRVAIQLAQGGAVIGVTTGQLGQKALGVTLAPVMLSRIFSSSIGLKWLTTGLEAPAGSAAAAKAGTQLLAFLAREGFDLGGGGASPSAGPPPFPLTPRSSTATAPGPPGLPR